MYMRGCCRFSGGLGGPEGPWEGTQNHKNEVTKSKRLFHFTEKKTHFLMSTFFWSLLYWSDQTSTVASIAAAFLKAREDPKVPGKGWHSHKFDTNTFKRFNTKKNVSPIFLMFLFFFRIKTAASARAKNKHRVIFDSLCPG